MAGDHQTASIISISGIAFWLDRHPASIIRHHQTASIISISWVAFWLGTTRRPASSASAGSRFGWGPPDGQHHQHQLGRVLAGDHQTASIISISWIAFWPGTTRRPASSASAGSRFGSGPPDGQHHQHQLGRVLAGDRQTASIISISWIAFWLGTTRRPASSASAGSRCWLGTARWPASSASSASAGSRFGWEPPDGQHHQHQLSHVFIGECPTMIQGIFDRNTGVSFGF